MSTQVIVYVLTGLALVVVVLTRLRMGRGQGAGRLYVGKSLLNVHTVSGVLAIVVWLTFLISSADSALGDPLVGIVALGFWWVVTVCGLLMLVRWLPSSGKHASDGVTDTWSEGPGLSILAHVGMLTGVCVFTWAYLTSAV
ncbi:hypothetical protein [Nocardioides sp.]|uniref:hypothetical protein n=1 Tax=Nocardioides sp. TaxID=35761 RepID=UPI0035666F89